MGIDLWSAGFDEPEARARLKLCFECFPVWPAMPFDVLPIVHAGALKLCVVEFETERLDQVQDRPGGRAETRHIAGVGRDFGFEKDDIHVFSRKRLSKEPA